MGGMEWNECELLGNKSLKKDHKNTLWQDPYWSIAPCWLSRSGEEVPSAVGPDLLHLALLRARVKVTLTIGEYFLKVFAMGLLGKMQANCFRNHHELTMYPLGN